MRVPVKIGMSGSHEVSVELDGTDVSDAVLNMAFQVHRDQGPVLYLEIKADAEIDLPADVHFGASMGVREFLYSVDGKDLRAAVDNGDFATHPADHVLALLKSKAGMEAA